MIWFFLEALSPLKDVNPALHQLASLAACSFQHKHIDFNPEGAFQVNISILQ